MFKSLIITNRDNSYQLHLIHEISGYHVSMDNESYFVQNRLCDFSDKNMSLKKKLEEIHQQCIKLMSI